MGNLEDISCAPHLVRSHTLLKSSSENAQGSETCQWHSKNHPPRTTNIYKNIYSYLPFFKNIYPYISLCILFYLYISFFTLIYLYISFFTRSFQTHSGAVTPFAPPSSGSMNKITWIRRTLSKDPAVDFCLRENGICSELWLYLAVAA